ncbi:MAG: MFS transporter [SAR202 cluster bacterium]|nr:MFS transporter [SAR202 cluster bacterium]MDP6662528.1 MFS transporter [SAR202 cluster bacterium]MDP6801397.1 MFS transporter [SAR202 cluster bacterium]
MVSFITKAPRARRTLFFGSAMHIWSDLFFAVMVPLLPFIKEDMDLSFTEVGMLRSVFNGASAVLQVPAGFLAEGMGEFWLLIWGNIWVAAGLAAMAASPVFVLLLASSAIGGLGGGAQHPLASSMVSRAYDDRGRSTAVGTVNFAGDLGKMLAPAVAGIFAVSFGWRSVLLIVSVSGAVFMLCSMLTRRVVDMGRPAASERAGSADSGVDDNARMGGFITLSGLGILDSAARSGSLVFLPFVLESKGLGLAQVSGMLFLLFAGGAAGKFVCGWLGDRIGTVSLIWWTKGLTAVMLVIATAAPAWTMAPLMVLTGIGLNGTSSVLYATVAEFVPATRRGRFYGFFYTTNEAGTIIAPLVYGLIADLASLKVTMVVMGIATATILPASLTLRKHLVPRIVGRSNGIRSVRKGH